MNLSFLLPAMALALGIATSIYFLRDWFMHKSRPRLLLLWAGGLFLMYWFQVPGILAALGKSVTISRFNLFFALTLPITFLALILFYLGIVDALDIKIKRTAKIALFVWFASAALFFGYTFVLHKGVIETYSVPLIGNLVFYMPLRLLIIATFIWWFYATALPLEPKTKIFAVLGSLGVVVESLLGILRNIMVIKMVLSYPPSFWYLAMTSNKTFFVLQTTSIFFLVFGFYFLHRMYYRTRAIQGPVI